VCGAFNAAFAELLWPLVAIISKYVYIMLVVHSMWTDNKDREWLSQHIIISSSTKLLSWAQATT